jgi:hypothetical protein
MSNRGELAEEIQRRSAEIDSWPSWAQPFDQSATAPPGQQEVLPASSPAEPGPSPQGSCERERASDRA